MEVEDPASGCVYLEHSISGETKWKAAEGTVWEEMKDPVTQEHYYYSNTGKDAQWTKPKWIDYICQDTGSLYYLNTETGMSTWSRPEEFTELVEGGRAEEKGSEAGAAARIRLSLADEVSTPQQSAAGIPAALAATPRDLPMATPRQVAQPALPTMGKAGGVVGGPAAKRTVSETVTYSMAKRPKTAPPKKKKERVDAIKDMEDDNEAASG